jgi:hypothetical protein
MIESSKSAQRSRRVSTVALTSAGSSHTPYFPFSDSLISRDASSSARFRPIRSLADLLPSGDSPEPPQKLQLLERLQR